MDTSRGGEGITNVDWRRANRCLASAGKVCIAMRVQRSAQSTGHDDSRLTWNYQIRDCRKCSRIRRLRPRAGSPECHPVRADVNKRTTGASDQATYLGGDIDGARAGGVAIELNEERVGVGTRDGVFAELVWVPGDKPGLDASFSDKDFEDASCAIDARGSGSHSVRGGGLKAYRGALDGTARATPVNAR